MRRRTILGLSLFLLLLWPTPGGPADWPEQTPSVWLGMQASMEVASSSKTPFQADNTTRYLLIGWGPPTASNETISYFDTTESKSELIVSRAGVLRDLAVSLASAPGAGSSNTITVRKNGSDTLLTVTISESDRSGVDTTNVIEVAAGDRLTAARTAAGTPAASRSFSVVWRYVPKP